MAPTLLGCEACVYIKLYMICQLKPLDAWAPV